MADVPDEVHAPDANYAHCSSAYYVFEPEKMLVDERKTESNKLTSFANYRARYHDGEAIQR